MRAQASSVETLIERAEVPIPDTEERSAQVEPIARPGGTRLRTVLGYGGVAALALSLRLWFILGVSKIVPVWDAMEYWYSMLGVRDALCLQLGTCGASGFDVPIPTLDKALHDVVTGHSGWLSLLGGMLTVLPAEPTSVLVLYAILDTLVCLMIVGIARRWGAPLWVALLAGALHAVYIPAITGTGAVLQQPVIRFLLVGAVWAYNRAFTGSEQGRWAWVWMGLGSLAVLVLGFAALTNRPLIWLIQLLVIGLSILGRPLRTVRNAQLVYTGVTLALVLGLSWLLFSTGEPADSWTVPLVGLSTEGGALGQSTVLSFEHFWPTDAWASQGRTATESIVGDITRAPVSFTLWWGYSLFSNWRYPDYLYFQTFLLDLDGQRLQHAVLVILGLAGLAGLLGLPGRRRRVVTLILVVGAAMSLVYSMISVEPRRLSVLSPFLALGAAVCIWGLWGLFVSLLDAIRKRGVPRWLPGAGVVAAVALLVLIVPVGLLAGLAPAMAGVAHTAVVLARGLVAVAGTVGVAVLAGRLAPTFRPVLPAAFLVGVVGVATVAQLLDTEWRAWSVHVSGPVRQTVLRAQGSEAHLHPWLVVDATRADGLQSAAIYVNDRLVKPNDAPVYVWRAGVPPFWRIYRSAIEVANPPPPLRTWLAVPLPRDLDRAAPLTIEIRTGERPLGLWGDYLDSPTASYVGPLVDPGFSANSFWRWQWNGSDPRIPAAQPFGGLDYTSSYMVEGERAGQDGEATWGKPPGLYRVFLVETAFAPSTNALPPLESDMRERPPTCQGTDLVSIEYPGLPFVCSGDGRVTYHSAEGAEVGATEKALLRQPFGANELIERIVTPTGRVDVVGVTRGVQAAGAVYGLYVATFYAAGGEPVYSLAYRLVLPPSP